LKPSIPAMPVSVVLPEREREREREREKGAKDNIQSRQAQILKSTSLVDRMCSLLVSECNIQSRQIQILKSSPNRACTQ